MFLLRGEKFKQIHIKKIISTFKKNVSGGKIFDKFTLIFSLDQHLRLWAIDKNDRQACGDTTPTPPTASLKKRDKKTDSEFFPQDLSSEFAKIKKYGIPGVQIEKVV